MNCAAIVVLATLAAADVRVTVTHYRGGDFEGIYSVDYGDHDAKPVDYERIADWLTDRVAEYL